MVDVGGVEKSNIRAFTGQWEEKRGGGGVQIKSLRYAMQTKLLSRYYITDHLSTLGIIPESVHFIIAEKSRAKGAAS